MGPSIACTDLVARFGIYGCFPVHAAQVELNQTVTLQMRKVKLADVFKKLSNLSGYEFSMMRVLSKSIIRLILIWTM